MFGWFKPKYKFNVAIECNGEHPTTYQLDYFEGTKIIDIEILARNFGEAEKLAMKIFKPTFDVWNYWVKTVTLVDEYF